MPAKKPRQIKIERRKFWVKPYTRKDGTKVRGHWVSATTFKRKDVGSPGVRSRGAKSGKYSKKKGYKPWITREGKLGGKGYLSKSTVSRRRILNRCVKNWGYRSCLGSIMVLNRSSTLRRKYGRKLDEDKEYLKRKYGGKGSFGPRK